MNRQNKNPLTLEEKKIELAQRRVQWEALKKQEADLKKEFYASPKNSGERARIKGKLESLQETIFEKGEEGYWIKRDVKDEEMFQKLKNASGPATDPHQLASLIKEELRAVLEGRTKFRAGDQVGDIWPVNHDQEINYFGQNKEIREKIANLVRNRQKPVDLDGIISRQVRVKRNDFSAADFKEMISLVHQVQKFLEEQEKQDRQRKENVKLNNPHLFSQGRCSTDGEYNGRGRWENWHTFSGKHNGFDYTINVPDEHFALTNVLFNDGWGRNSEIGEKISGFYVVEGVPAPKTLCYWNVARQREEIISEAEGRRLLEQGDIRVYYHTYVEINDKISIDHYSGDLNQELAKPVSGVNSELVKNGDRPRAGGSTLVASQKDNPVNFLVELFQKHNIQQISLSAEGELVIKYKDDKQTEIANGDNSLLMKNFLRERDKLSLNYSQLQTLASQTNQQSLPGNSPASNKPWIIGGTVVGVSLIGVAVVGYCWYSRRRNAVKKQG